MSEEHDTATPPASDPAEPAKQLVEEAKAQAAAAAEPEAEPEAEPIPADQVVLARALMRWLVEKHPRVSDAVEAMIAARQLYIVAYRELESLLATDDQWDSWIKHALASLPEPLTELPAPRDVISVTEEGLVGAVAAHASKPFNEQQLFPRLKQVVFPWLERTVERHNRNEQAQQQEEIAEAEAARRARPLPIGLRRDPEGESLLPRSQRLVLVGWQPAVRYLLDQITSSVLAASDEQLFCIVRLMSQISGQSPDHARLLRFGDNLWKGCCRRGTTWPRLFTDMVFPQLSQAVDLLICDDLALAGLGSGLVGGSAARQAAEALKHFHRWCDKAGAGLVAAVPLPLPNLPALEGPGWESLGVHTQLRAVQVEKTKTQYRLTIGKNAQVLHVPQEILDGAAGPALILPD